MDDQRKVAQLLRVAVGDAFDTVQTPTAAYFTTRRRQRLYRRWSVGAAVCLTAALAAVLAVVTHTDAGRSTARPRPVPTRDGVSATELASYRWSRLPSAPIDGRGEAAAVWTGTQMIVWGGSADGGRNVFGDGASYDPVSRQWQTLPPAPLSARSAPAFTYAHGSLFIWGGQQRSATPTNALDGALYDPTTRTWTLLPRSPVTNYRWAQALWTGHEVLLLSEPAHGHAEVVHADAFDPDTRHWSTLPDLSLPDAHQTLIVRALSADADLYVWVLWYQTAKTGPSTHQRSLGINGYTLDTSTNQWSRDHLVPTQRFLVDQPILAKPDIVIPASQDSCITCIGPSAFGTHGYLIDPDTGAIAAMQPGPIDALIPRYVWTGAALLAYDPTVTGVDLPGATATWDPATNRWTTLPRAPLTGTTDTVVSVWTGHSLIEWGAMYPTNSTNPEAQPSQTAGLELGPG